VSRARSGVACLRGGMDRWPRPADILIMGMAVRLLLILTLLVQPLTLGVASIRAGGDDTCVATACCEVLETTTCCGRVVSQMRCGKTGRTCVCGMTPEDSTPAPETPRAPERTEMAPIFAAGVGIVLDVRAPALVCPRRTPPACRRTHNETQALLCIWRT